jgi:hypothetical protein
VEASVLGNLSAQMIALGEIETLATARALIRASFQMNEYTPQSVLPPRVLECFERLLAAKELRGETCA